MSKLTLDEAIKHCLEVAEQNEAQAEKIGRQLIGSAIDKYATDCQECAADHRQLAEWLTELKEAKRLLKAAVEDMYNSVNDVHCKYCSKWHTDQCQETSHLDCYIENKFKWRHEDEALALIGEDANVPASADGTNVGGKIDSWISCEDRLPGENTLVLCYARSTTGEGNQYFIGAIAHGEFWFLKVYDIGRVSHPVHYWEVTHWQPLPEPPKDGEQNV